MFQDLALCGNLDVTSNIFLGRELTDGALLDDGRMEQVARGILRDLTLRIPSVRTPLSELSAGQRQAVAIARTLIGSPRLVVLDEPTAALSVAQTAEVLTYIERLRDLGHGVILISHNMNDVRAVVGPHRRPAARPQQRLVRRRHRQLRVDPRGDHRRDDPGQRDAAPDGRAALSRGIGRAGLRSRSGVLRVTRSAE